jgi:transcriptional regulator with XRE-family HTH domain
MNEGPPTEDGSGQRWLLRQQAQGGSIGPPWEAGNAVRRDREYFAEWLSRTLAEREIAGGEVARALGVNDSAISRWKNGKASPGLDSVMKLADFLDVNPVALAVTAGLMKEGQVGVERLPLPKETRIVAHVEEQIMKIRGLDDETRKALIATLREKYES